ncbi:MAG: hypothetical protein CMP48_09840 [Rickettsiales bacterium]|nr:hypothetical protein [Rickettsiales bacterium]
MLNNVLIWSSLILAVFIGAEKTGDTRYTGVYRGKTLFIQNPYDRESSSFCITEVRLNNRRLNLNYGSSALKIDFNGIEENSPIALHIIHSDSCQPIIINPDAIAYKYTFAFKEISMNDSVLVWSSIGDQEQGVYTLDAYDYGIWQTQDTVLSKGKHEGATYVHFPKLKEGPNKLRLKYTFPSGDYIYSREIDFHYYEEPVTFTPKKSSTSLTLSRYASYEIYDGGYNLVMSGSGASIDIRDLKRGDYIIYFDNKDPGVFTKI